MLVEPRESGCSCSAHLHFYVPDWKDFLDVLMAQGLTQRQTCKVHDIFYDFPSARFPLVHANAWLRARDLVDPDSDAQWDLKHPPLTNAEKDASTSVHSQRKLERDTITFEQTSDWARICQVTNITGWREQGHELDVLAEYEFARIEFNIEFQDSQGSIYVDSTAMERNNRVEYYTFGTIAFPSATTIDDFRPLLQILITQGAHLLKTTHSKVIEYLRHSNPTLFDTLKDQGFIQSVRNDASEKCWSQQFPFAGQLISPPTVPNHNDSDWTDGDDDSPSLSESLDLMSDLEPMDAEEISLLRERFERELKL